MNNERREHLKNATEKLAEARGIFESVKQEEEEAYQNLPENLQNSDNGEAMSQNISVLEEAINSIETAEAELDNIV